MGKGKLVTIELHKNFDADTESERYYVILEIQEDDQNLVEQIALMIWNRGKTRPKTKIRQIGYLPIDPLLKSKYRDWRSHSLLDGRLV